MEEILKFDSILEKMQYSGMSSTDKKLFRDLGIDSETLVHFTANIQEVNEEKKEDILEQFKDKKSNIYNLINDKFLEKNQNEEKEKSKKK
jgi:hypothetical protein